MVGRDQISWTFAMEASLLCWNLLGPGNDALYKLEEYGEQMERGTGKGPVGKFIGPFIKGEGYILLFHTMHF